MLPRYHFIIGLLASLILFYFFQLTLLQAFIIFLSSVLIDIDHYFYYVFKKRDLNPINSSKWFFKKRSKWFKLSPEKRSKYKTSILIFHGAEFWVLLGFLSFFNSIFLFFLIGIVIHMLFDFIEMIYHQEFIYYKLSQAYVWLRNKRKKEFFI